MTPHYYRTESSKNKDLVDKYLLEADYSPCVTELTSSLIHPLQEKPISEMYTAVRMTMFIEKVFQSLQTYSLRGQDLHYEVHHNQSEKSRTTSSQVVRERARPGLMISAAGCTLMIGEDNCFNITSGFRDIREKMVSLSQMHYGPVSFMIGYVAAGNTVQWLYVDKVGKHRPVGDLLDFYMKPDRYKLLLSLACAYELLGTMNKRVPQLVQRKPLFVPDRSVVDRTITFSPDSMEKVLRGFYDFCARKAVAFEDVEAAYAVADELAREHPDRQPVLVKAKKKPEVVTTHRGIYLVETYPIGHAPQLDSEKTVKSLVRQVSQASEALHRNHLVHRDVRLDNIVQLNDSFMLIDFETVGHATAQPLPAGFDHVTGWDDNTLEGGQYTAMSGLYSLGRLMGTDLLGLFEASEEAIDLMTELKGEQVWR